MLRLRIKSWFTPPTLADADQTRLARILYQLELILLLVALAIIAINLLDGYLSGVYPLIVGMVSVLMSRALARQGRLQAAAQWMLLTMLGVITVLLYMGQGIHDSAVMAYLAVIILASLVLDQRNFIILSALTLLALGFIVAAELKGLVWEAFPGTTSWYDFAIAAAILITAAVGVRLLADDLRRSLAHARRELLERAQVQSALHESEARFHLMFEKHDAVMLLIDPGSGQIMDANEAAGKFYGYPVATLRTMRIDEINVLPPDEVAQRRQQALRGGLNYFVFPHRLANGEVRSVEVHSSPILVQGQTVLFSIIHDITTRQQAEEALRASEEKFRSLIEQSSEGVVLIDDQGTIAEWNLAEERITGVPRKRALGAALWDIQKLILLPERRGTHSVQVLQQGFFNSYTVQQAAQPSQPFEIEIVSVTGERKTILQTTFTIQLDKGKTCLGAIIRDVTERKQAEQALRTSEEKYRAIVNAVPDLLIQITREGVILDYRAPDESALYVPPEAFLGKNVTEVLPPDIAQAAIAATKAALATTAAAVFEYELPLHDELRFFEDRVMPLSGDTVLSVIRDITDRKRAEAKIRSTLEEKETLLREVHHRVKNNLQAMIALMEMQGNLISDEGTRQFLKELEGQARTMSLVYEQLYQSVNLARVKMAPYLQQLTYYIFETFGNRRAVQFSLEVAPLSLDVAQAMPCGLIVNELLTNTLKHAFPPDFEGQPAVHITLQVEADTYRLVVADNGVGLPADYDWHASRSLGLRLVKLWAVHQLGGTLDINTRSGVTYTLTFR